MALLLTVHVTGTETLHGELLDRQGPDESHKDMSLEGQLEAAIVLPCS